MFISRIFSKKNKVAIQFDNGESIFLRYDTVLKFGLKKNLELDEKTYLKLLDENLRFEIKELSFKLLSQRLHSSHELKKKLIRRKFPEKFIDEIIHELSEREYLDDFKFAWRLADEKIKSKKLGPMAVKQILFTKGISLAIIDNVMHGLENPDEELKNAIIIAKKKMSGSAYQNIPPFKIKEKLYMYLVSKGYSAEIIHKTFKNLPQKYNMEEMFD